MSKPQWGSIRSDPQIRIDAEIRPDGTPGQIEAAWHEAFIVAAANRVRLPDLIDLTGNLTESGIDLRLARAFAVIAHDMVDVAIHAAAKAAAVLRTMPATPEGDPERMMAEIIARIPESQEFDSSHARVVTDAFRMRRLERWYRETRAPLTGEPLLFPEGGRGDG